MNTYSYYNKKFIKTISIIIVWVYEVIKLYYNNIYLIDIFLQNL